MKQITPILIASSLGLALCAAPAHAAMVIVPTFGASITSDPNAAAIEAVLNGLIATYEAQFSDSITVNITFNSMSTGLGQSSFSLYQTTYSAFHTALTNDATSADDTTALTRLAVDGGTTNNPVTGTANVLIKSANAKALNLNVGASGQDGVISLNTHITDVGSPGTTGQFSLAATASHEIDEVLGLGSTLGLGLGSPFNNYPSPEDFFRFTSGGARSFTASNSSAFFSIDGTTDLAQFDNQADGGDYGDWQSNPLPVGVSAQVQDAFSTPGANPSLGVELRALDVIGYDRINPAPEPGTFAMIAGGLGLCALVRRRTRKGPAVQ